MILHPVKRGRPTKEVAPAILSAVRDAFKDGATTLVDMLTDDDAKLMLSGIRSHIAALKLADTVKAERANACHDADGANIQAVYVYGADGADTDYLDKATDALAADREYVV